MFVADLKVLSGKHHGKVITLKTKKFLVGRGEDCHLRPNNDLISRHHCIFTCDEYSVRLRDLGSTNGTFINNEQLRGQTILKTGDQIRIGKLEFEVTVREEVPVAVNEPGTAETPGVELPDDSAVRDGSADETMAGLETLHEIPVAPPAPQVSGETAAMSTSETEFVPPQQMPAQPPPLQYAPGAMPPGYAYPPQQMPPGYAPPAVPPGVMPPGQYPYPYPQQQQMPPGYPPGYPAQPMVQPQMPGYPAAFPGQPEQEVESTDSGSVVDNVPVKLPDPSQTGAVEEVKSTQKKEASNEPAQETPSSKAGDIIQQMINRRPG